MLTFGRDEYRWDPLKKEAESSGVRKSTVDAAGKSVELPAASMVVLRGALGGEKK
jgi:hypothetical protein